MSNSPKSVRQPPSTVLTSEPSVTTRMKPTAFDGLLAALSPILIIGMICCLVFFLITIFYRGDFTIRLMYILGLFTFASVFIARIAVEQTRALAFGYTSILGVATFCVVLRFVQFPGAMAIYATSIVIGFLLLIYFLSDRITHDCTLIDESKDASGEGLLQSLGLVRSPLTSERKTGGKVVQPEVVNSHARSLRDNDKTKVTPLNTLIAADSKTNKKTRKHNPGVWVLYFSIIAIPLFGLGQLSIPTFDRLARQQATGFLFGYLFFAMSLLVITSLLGLRRYLRQRNLDMPLGLSATWILSGTIGALLLLVVTFLLPFPERSISLADFPLRFESPKEPSTSKHGWGAEGANKAKEAAPKTGLNAKPDTASDPKQKNGVQKSTDKNSNNQNESKSDAKLSNKEQKKGDGEKSNADQSKADPANAKQQPKPTDSPPPPQSPPSISMSGGIENLLRWIAMVLLVLVLAFCMIRYWSDFVVAIRAFIDSLKNLFRFKQESTSGQTSDKKSNVTDNNLVSFHQFIDPFGEEASSWSSAKIVRHTFDALEAWGRERSVTRHTDETPEEYLKRLTHRYPIQSESLQVLTQLYNRLAYAASTVDSTEVTKLTSLWKWLRNPIGVPTPESI